MDIFISLSSHLYYCIHSLVEADTGFSLNIVFFTKKINILRPLPCKDRAAIGCAENGEPIRMTVHSGLRSDELISYMQGDGLQ